MRRKYQYQVLLKDGSKLTLTTFADNKSQALSRCSSYTSMVDDYGKVQTITVLKSTFKWIE